MIKASRRAIFRNVFGRTGFELQLDTANEILMRLNGSLDPIPVAERMWASYRANRRPLRYSDDRLTASDSVDVASAVDAAVAHAHFDDFPQHVERDLTLLLRIEALMRMWLAASRPNPGPTSSDERRFQILAALKAEMLRYVANDETRGAIPCELVDEVVAYLTDAAGVGRPSSD